MMAIKIKGTDATKSLINNVVSDMRKEKPALNLVEYSVSTKDKKGIYSELNTSEENGILKNISILYVRGLDVVIGNLTGNMIIRSKPFYLSSKKVMSQVCKFLQDIKSANVSNMKWMTGSKISNPHFFANTKSVDTPDSLNISKKIIGFSHKGKPEVYDDYINL